MNGVSPEVALRAAYAFAVKVDGFDEVSLLDGVCTAVSLMSAFSSTYPEQFWLIAERRGSAVGVDL